ncbi:MAG TPA: LysR family transcriptional regulator [Halothiobacillaceae bacterium]|nr:LysR family transcriptional regulator [Halothiobacillaceae bacterium]
MFLELRHLRTLAAIAQTESLAQAAERLHVTQSALSHQIRAIESYYNTPLFSRRSRPMRPTEAGRRFLAAAEVILPEVDKLDRDLKQIAGGGTGRLYLALECHSCFTWLIPALEQYRGHWPQIDTDLSIAHSFDAIDALRRGELDGVISSDPVDDPDLVFLPLFRYSIVLAMAPDHKLNEQPAITPQMLRDETIIHYPVERKRLDIFQRFLTPAGIEPAATRTSELTAMIAQWVASGRGVAALPKWAITNEVERGIITTRPLSIHPVQVMDEQNQTQTELSATLHLAVRREDHELSFIEAFVRLAREQAANRLNGINLV